MRSGASIFPALLSTISLVARAEALEEPVRAALEWTLASGTDHCMSRDQVRTAVEERLGRTVFVNDSAADVKVRGRIQHTQQSFTVEIELSSKDDVPMGSRTLESKSPECSSLDDSIALILAVMLDIPEAHVPPPTPASNRPAPAEGPTKRATSQVPPLESKLHVPADTPPRRPVYHFDMGLGALSSWGLLPEVGWGARAHLAIVPPSFAKFGVDLSAYRSVSDEVQGTGAGANFSPMEVGWFVCPLAFTPSEAGVEVCVVQHVGRLRVEGYGFDSNHSETRSYINLGVKGALGLPIAGPLSGRVSVQFEAPLERDSFRYGTAGGGDERLFRMSPVIATGQLGVAAQFE